MKKLGVAHFPICIAKTQYSFSTDAKAYGPTEGFELHVRDITLNIGAEMIVVIAGPIMRMPGLPSRHKPSAHRRGEWRDYRLYHKQLFMNGCQKNHSS